MTIRLPLMTLLMFCIAASPLLAADKELPIIYQDDFEKGADRWEPTDVSAWKIVKTDKGNVYSQHKKRSKYNPPPDDRPPCTVPRRHGEAGRPTCGSRRERVAPGHRAVG